MGIHDKAWSGLSILVYGNTPTLPMRIEQTLAAATPGNEVRIESFEDYDQAYEHCRNSRNVGFILILENTGSVLAADAFAQLSAHYEANGWPCFGVLLYEDAKSFVGYRSLEKNKRLIHYASANEATNPNTAYQFLMDIWNHFVKAFESTVIPEPLQRTLLALAASKHSDSSHKFMERVSEIIIPKLNISWIETLAIKWNPVIVALRTTAARSLEANSTLVQISDLANSAHSGNLVSTVSSQQSLCARLTAVLLSLDTLRISGHLVTELEQIANLAKPGAPALLRHIATAKKQIIQIAAEVESQDLSRKTG